jgi:uncharacterized protein YbdZ (MbtH family)
MTTDAGGDPEAPPMIAYLTRDTKGQIWPDDLANEADLCPAGWTYLGGTGFTAACLADGPGTILNLTRDAKGQIWPDDVPNESDLCPAGWSYLGGSGFSATCNQP